MLGRNLPQRELSCLTGKMVQADAQNFWEDNSTFAIVLQLLVSAANGLANWEPQIESNGSVG